MNLNALCVWAGAIGFRTGIFLPPALQVSDPAYGLQERCMYVNLYLSALNTVIPISTEQNHLSYISSRWIP